MYLFLLSTILAIFSSYSLLANFFSTDFLCQSFSKIPSPSPAVPRSHHTPCMSQHMMNNEINTLSMLFPSSAGHGALSQDTRYCEALLNANLRTWKGVFPKLNRHTLYKRNGCLLACPSLGMGTYEWKNNC